MIIDQGRIAGLLILDKTSEDCLDIDWLIVTVAYYGKGVGDELITHALYWMGDQADVKLRVIYYNERALGFMKNLVLKAQGK